MDSVENKVALVFGGAGGIGLAIVKKLLENGAKGVAIVDLSETRGQEAIREVVDGFGDDKAIFIKADVTDKLQLEDVFEQTIETYNQLDVVVNSAGILNEHDWQKTVAVNLIAVIEATYLAMQKYLPKHKSGEEGVIVNIASISGFYPFQALPVYCTTKHGLVGFGRVLGGEEYYKKYKVRVLTVCPGVVDTSFSENKGELLLFPHTLDEDVLALEATPEPPEYVGEALIEVIQKGKSGSLWVTENSEPVYEVKVPHYRNMRVL